MYTKHIFYIPTSCSSIVKGPYCLYRLPLLGFIYYICTLYYSIVHWESCFYKRIVVQTTRVRWQLRMTTSFFSALKLFLPYATSQINNTCLVSDNLARYGVTERYLRCLFAWCVGPAERDLINERRKTSTPETAAFH